jgi:hypothetical protein
MLFVHLEELMREERGLLAAGTSANFEHKAGAIVVSVVGREHEILNFLALGGEGGLSGGKLVQSELAELLILSVIMGHLPKREPLMFALAESFVL